MPEKKSNTPNSRLAQSEHTAPKRLITSRDQTGNVVAPKRTLPNLESIQVRSEKTSTSEDLLKNSLKRNLLDQLNSFNDNLTVSRTLLRSEHLLFSDLMAFFSTRTHTCHRVLYELLFDIQINEYLFIEPFHDTQSSFEAATYLWDAYFNHPTLCNYQEELVAPSKFEPIVEQLSLIGEQIDQAQSPNTLQLKDFAEALTSLKEVLFSYLSEESNALMEDQGKILTSFLSR